MINCINSKEYLEGIDYYVDFIHNENIKGLHSNEFLFKNNKGNLISYIRVNIDTTRMIAYIVDITNSNGFEYFSEKFQKFYLSNGYNSGESVKGFGEVALNHVLYFIKDTYPKLEIVLLNSYERNKKNVLNLVDKVQKNVDSIIKRVNGGGEIAACTIFI